MKTLPGWTPLCPFGMSTEAMSLHAREAKQPLEADLAVRIADR